MTTFLLRPFVPVFATGLIFFVSTVGDMAVGAEPRGERKQQAASSPNEAEDKKLDLNTASARALSAVAVIGADSAQAIIAARPYTTLDDLNRITGLSAERLEQIRAKVKVAPEAIPAPAVEKTKRVAAKARAANDSPKLNVNTASYEALAALPSAGPEVARAIIAARPLASLDDLSRIKGISAERLEQLRLNLTLSEASAKRPASER